MKLQTIVRYLFGYLIGLSVFLWIIPYGVFCLSKASFSIPLPVHDAIRLTVALVLGCAGLFFLFWSNTALLLQGKGGPVDAFNVPISPRTKHLVVNGPYRHTRNPMVFGAFSLYLALAIFWNSLTALTVLALFFIAVRLYLRATEEKRLLKDFGREYEEYRNQVRMIVPIPSRKRQSIATLPAGRGDPRKGA
jgi:protein-S-isoprenylcysteine O-methyltransferase Ste14